MKDTLKLFGIIVLAAVIGFSFASCNGEIFNYDPTGGSSSEEEEEEGEPVEVVAVIFIADMATILDSEFEGEEETPYMMGMFIANPADFGSIFDGAAAPGSTIKYITGDFAVVSAAITTAIGSGKLLGTVEGDEDGGLALTAVEAALDENEVETADKTAILGKLGEEDFVVAYILTEIVL